MATINETPQYIPTWKITPSAVLGYYSYVGERKWKPSCMLFTTEDGIKKETYQGEITKHSRKRLKQACELLFTLSRSKKVQSPSTGRFFKFRIALITLTLSAPQQNFSDHEIKTLLLAPFLRHFRNKGMRNYIWKAERQRNGNIHFHILTDTFIDKTEIRNYWNRIQAQFGFIDRFEQKHGHRDPNSTDIKAVKSEEGMIQYMFKYMMKPTEKEEQKELGRDYSERGKGKIWDCSINLKIKNDTAKEVEDWEFELMEERTKRGEFEKVETDFCTIYIPLNKKIWDISPSTLSSRLITYLRKVRADGSLEVWEEKYRKGSSVNF